MSIYARHYNRKRTAQSEKIPGSAQVENSAGGYSFPVTDWVRLDRFLVLGSEGGSYYASERTLSMENAEAVIRCIHADGLRTVARIVELSEAGRAPKNDPAIFALALCLKLGDVDTRRAAKDAVPRVCRISTHLFQLAQAVSGLGGWGRLTVKAFADWYRLQDAHRLALNLVKYQQRHGFRHKDLMRKAHVGRGPSTLAHQALYRWVSCDGNLDARHVERIAKDGRILSEGSYPALSRETLPRIIEGFERAQAAQTPKESAALIWEYGLPRECVKTDHLRDVGVWEALLLSDKGMPLTAMIRNLGKMANVGLLAPLSDASRHVVSRLSDRDALKTARVHPMSLLMALRTYEKGRGVKGSLRWVVDRRIVAALDEAFYLAFDSVVPTGKKWLLALDVSGSMTAPVMGTPLSAREASAAMALLTMKTEKTYHVIGFTAQSSGLRMDRQNANLWSAAVAELDLHHRMSLTDVLRKTSQLPFAGTDCALPMLYATAHKLEVDVFVVYTDSETWAGSIHPVQALCEYRQKMSRAAKLIVVGMCSNGFSIADPEDAGMLDVVGFDTATPDVMANFARG